MGENIQVEVLKENMQVIVCSVENDFANILNVENMNFVKLPIFPNWKSIIYRALNTHEILNIGCEFSKYHKKIF